METKIDETQKICKKCNKPYILPKDSKMISKFAVFCPKCVRNIENMARRLF